jgi:hypothetical protein
MKHLLKGPKSILPLTILMVIFCWNGSTLDSNGKDKRPDVNFYGTLTDHISTNTVEDILIGGKYEQIAVYQNIKTAKKPIEKTKESGLEIDPKQNKIMLDLHEVSSIELAHPDRPIESEVEINNRKYIEISVTSITGTKQTYLIESSREISCRNIDKGPEKDQTPVLEERKLNMTHVKNLTIKGYKSAKDVKSKSVRQEEQADKVDVSTETEKILDQMEEKVKNLPKQHPSQYESFKNSMLTLLRGLREQLQKMLNMLKN